MAKARIDLQKAVYSLGEQVSGAIHLSLDKPVSQRSATAYLLGKEKTWVSYTTTAYVGGRSQTHTETAVQENDFLNQEFPIPLPMNEDGKSKPGDYTIPFGFTLPQAFPPTYSGKHAKITYAVFAKIDVPHWRDIRESSEFVVVPSPLQVARPQPILAAPVVPNDGKVESFGPANKPGIEFTLDKANYCRGEVISGTCKFINPPSKSIRDIDVALRWIEGAVAQGHPATTEIMKETSKIPIGGRIYQGGSPFSIRVPREAPPTYESALSNLRCTLSVGLDISLGHDTAARRQIAILP
jgi:hypothetical protein